MDCMLNFKVDIIYITNTKFEYLKVIRVFGLSEF